MGKVEKVIVLSVLFLVALILVVTVTVDDPLDKSGVVEAGGKQAPAAVAKAPSAAPQPAAPLLQSSVQPIAPGSSVAPAGAASAPPAAQPLPQQPAVVAAPAPAPASALPPGALLQTFDGLEDSWVPDLKLYTWKQGDSWRALAHTFYGDWKRLDLLKRHNEGRMEVEPGDTVFVPVFSDERARQAAAQPAAGAAPTAASAEPRAGAKKMHVVASGESLWKIAKSELGDGNRWKEIYEANRDVLKSPEAIQKGMRLRIP
ncbi:MAG: LysM peptidoglycan-binding domain-containing protein [Planctomycetes bacterium]|nr:LysM peptidoglycan-binding domain-containing protein [Planctomycetota bacterium]